MSARNTLAGKATRRAQRAVRRLLNERLTNPWVRITVCRYCDRRRQVFTAPAACGRCIAKAVAGICPPPSANVKVGLR